MTVTQSHITMNAQREILVPQKNGPQKNSPNKRIIVTAGNLILVIRTYPELKGK